MRIHISPRGPLVDQRCQQASINPVKDFDYRKADLHHGTTMEIGDQYCIMGRGCRPVEMAIIAAVPGLQEIKDRSDESKKDEYAFDFPEPVVQLHEPID